MPHPSTQIDFPRSTAVRFPIHDNDCIFSDRVAEAIGQLGIESKRTAYRSPWQNGTAERGSGPFDVNSWIT